MRRKTRIGIEILATAAVIGLAGNFLLRQTPWGLNAFFFVSVFVIGMIAVAYRHRPELLTLRTLSLQAAMVFFASMFLIRDAEELLVWDTFMIIVLMGVLILPNFGIDQRVAGIFHYIAGSVWSGISSLFAPLVLLGADIDWKEMPGNRLSRSVVSVFRGIAIALPLFLVFGALFMAADAAFEDFANRLVNFDVETIISHVMLTSLLAWLVAGYFRGTMVEHFSQTAAGVPASNVSVIPKEDPAVSPNRMHPAATTSFVESFASEPAEGSSLPNNATILEHINISDPPNAEQATAAADNASLSSFKTNRKYHWQNFDNTKLPSVFTLGTVETLIILGTLNVLFVSFVVFQLPYLFGGFEFVQNTPDLKLADFARRGFGELVAVSFLVLPVLLLSHWLLRRDDTKNELVFRVLAGIQIILLFVIMASAMQRLVLLTGELGYGWTTVRFYPMVVMIWLAVVFVWFGWTVLRGQRNNFAWGALWSAILILGAANLMNPHHFIARKNIQLMQQGREFDAYYHSTLSDDAIPVLMQAFPEMRPEDKCSLGSGLHYRYRELGQISDLRSFNLSRQLAFRSLRDNDGLLHQTEGCPNGYHNDMAPDGSEIPY
ncbi:DUF4173 domain-containing protein [Leptolyngbya sp. 7M]|uniref:DUF4153 domain-containing protein n=1 Tax=Leptolyngbya sp. 7M TaxID=2812896 RepID=UPI001B8D2A25|nr:DUF4173 domain-containing protein [Leptolyngbya sp. 7M]QYO65634.1 DUF4173 domain-containing protein [Leptolyngbya sp. 7M]